MFRKYCPTCQTEKDTQHFYRSSTRYDGLTSLCKECIRANSKAYYQKRRDYYVSKATRWNKNNIEQHRRNQKRYRLRKVLR